MIPLGLFGTFGLQEMLVILVIVVFLFGARRIPEIAKGLGEGIRNFRTSLRGDETDSKQVEGGEDAPSGRDREAGNSSRP